MEVDDSKLKEEIRKKNLKEIASRYWDTNDIKSVLPKPDKAKIEKYNNVDVHWCKHCLSLLVVNCDLPDVKEYCESCSSTDIESGNIREWQKKIKQRDEVIKESNLRAKSDEDFDEEFFKNLDKEFDNK